MRDASDDIEIAIGAADLRSLDEGEIRRLDVESASASAEDVDLPALLDALGDSDWRVRREAAGTLASFNEDEVTERLVGALSSDDAGMRNAAMKALIKRGELSIPALLACMRGADADTRVLAAVSVGQIRSEASVPELIRLLEAETDPNVRYMIIEALGRIGDPRALIALMGMLDEDAWLAAVAARALGEIGSPHATNRLIGLLVDPIVGGVAATALGMIGDARAIVPLYEAAAADIKRESRPYIVALGQILGSGPIVQSGVGALLRSCASNPPEHVLRAIDSAMRDPDPGVRVPAAVVAGWVRHPSLVEGLVAALEDPATATECAGALLELWHADPDRVSGSVGKAPSFARAALLGLLATSGTPSDVALVRPLLDDINPHVRSEAVTTIGAIGSPQHAVLVVVHLYDDVFDVRVAAARAVGTLRVDAATEEILALVESERADDRLVAAYALAASGIGWDMSGLGSAVQLLARDADPRVRAAVIPAFSAAGGFEAAEFCVAMTTDEDDATAVAAIGALAKRGEEIARVALRDLADDPRPSIAAAALRAIAHAPRHEDCDILVAAARSGDPRRVISALDGLTRVACEHAEEIALRCAADSIPELRAAAIRILGRRPQNAVVARHLYAASEDSAWVVRAAAAEALGLVGGPDAIDTLAALADDPDPTVRCAALRSLPGIVGATSIPVLVAHLDEPSTGRAAFDAMCSLGDEGVGIAVALLQENPAEGGYGLAAYLSRLSSDASRAALERLMASTDELVRMHAAIAIATSPDEEWARSLECHAQAQESPTVSRILEFARSRSVPDAGAPR